MAGSVQLDFMTETNLSGGGSAVISYQGGKLPKNKAAKSPPAQNNLPVPVLAENGNESIRRAGAADTKDQVRESTETQPRPGNDSRGGQFISGATNGHVQGDPAPTAAPNIPEETVAPGNLK